MPLYFITRSSVWTAERTGSVDVPSTHSGGTEKCPDIAAIHVPHLSKALPRIYIYDLPIDPDT